VLANLANIDVVGHTGAPEIEKMVRNQFNAYVWTRKEEGSFADYGPLVDDGGLERVLDRHVVYFSGTKGRRSREERTDWNSEHRD